MDNLDKKTIRYSHPKTMKSDLRKILDNLDVLDKLRMPRPTVPPFNKTQEQKERLEDWDRQETVLNAIREQASRAYFRACEITEYNDNKFIKKAGVPKHKRKLYRNE